jgi:hypothetical protein
MPKSRSARRRARRYIGLLVLLALLGGGWSWFWQYAAKTAEQTIAGWRAREAKAGRIYTCGSQTLGGFPFRIEVLCDRAGAILRGGLAPVEIKTSNVHVAAQIYQPSLLISEFRGPFTVGDPGRPPSWVANWKLAQTSVRGTPAAPERLSIVLDSPTLDRVSPPEPILRAKHIELHGRMAEGSAANRPVIEIVLRLNQASVPALGPLAVVPIDADIDMVLRGLSDFSPKSWPQRFREIQAAGGRIDIASARIQQGDTIAVGSGALTLNVKGRLDGQINVAVAGIESFINAYSAANNQRSGLSLTLGLGLLGGNATVEGKRAIALPLRFDDGAIFLGPIAIGQTPALF